MKEKDLREEVRKTTEEEPLSKAITSIAEHVVDAEDRTKKDLKEIKEVVEGHKHETAEGWARVNEMFEQERKKWARLNSARFEDVTEPLKEVLPDSYIRRSMSFESAAASIPGSSKRLQDPTTYMAANRWFELSSKAQLTKFRGEQSKTLEELEKIEKAFEAVTKAAMQEDTAAEGGNLVPTLVAAEINRSIQDAGDIFPRMRQAALTTKVTNFPAENTAVTVNWITEESAITQGEPTFSQVAIQADKLAGRAKFSIELVQDSAPTLLQYLLAVFTEKMAGELDYQVVLGDGTSPEMLGIINGANLVQDTLSTQASLTWARLATGFTAAGEKNSRNNGVWICSPKGYSALIGLNASGVTVVQFGASVQDAPAGTLLGRPIVVSGRLGGSATLDDTTLTKTKILFGPPSAYVAGTRQGMAWDVTDAIGWANYQMDARLVGRFGGRPVVSGDFVSIENISY